MKKNTLLFLLFTISAFAVIPSMYRVLNTKNTVLYKNNSLQYFDANDLYAEDFEGVHNWVFVNGAQTNKWFVGTAVNNGGTKSLYISDNNGAANQYDTTGASVTHAYKDIVIPANTADVELSFDWRSVGDDWSDYLNVWLIPTSFTPGPGAQIFAGGDRIQIGGSFNGQATWTNYSTVVDISAYAGQTMRLVFQWTNAGWAGAQTPAAIDNVVLAPVTCSSPSDIEAENITTDGAEISWTAPGTTNVASYDYYISETNSITGTTTPTGNVTATTVDLENLTPATQYYFWVRSNCGTTDGHSLWTGPFAFFTQCVAINLPYTETFNSDSSTVNCWSVINNNNDDVQWNTNTPWNPFEGDQSANFPIVSWNPTVNDDYLVSPVFNFNGAYRLRYYYKMGWGSDSQSFSVKMSQNGGTGVTDFTETVVAEQGYSNENYVEKIVYLAAFTGQGAFAWYVGGSNNREIYIDKVIIEPIPTCPEPYELSTTQVTDESVSLSWQQYGTATSWEVIVLPQGEAIPADLTTITVYETNTASITIDGLEDITAYDIYVRAVCSATEQSEWSSVLEITTAPSNDECDEAVVLPVNPGPECVESVPGSVVGATQSDIGEVCEGTPYNDVWYEFTAESANHSVKLEIDGWATTYIAVYEEGICNEDVLTPIACEPTQLLNLDGLTIGNTYKVRIYTSEWNPDVTFDICVITLNPPISVSDTQYTVPELVTEILIDNPCATVSNVTWSTGSNFDDVNGIGYFNKNNSVFSFEEGIILSSGNIHLAPGPAGGTTGSGQMYDWPDDAQLTTYMNNYLNQPEQTYHNASVLEFDFVALTNELKFNFIFASNEYGSFQCSFSDSFAFFLTNTTTGVTTNLAIVPNTTDPVSVVTIRKAIHSPLNWETGEPDCADVNPDYFEACYDPGFNGQDPLLSPINFYGLTVPMVAQSDVVPGTTYHIKLVIQDRGDSGYDSAVFLEGGSFDLGSVDFGDDLLIDTGNALCYGDTYLLNSGLNPDSFEIQWYKDNVLIDGAEGTTLEVTESGEYKIEATFVGSTCVITDTIKVEIYPEIKIVAPKNIEICVFNNEIPLVDLTVNENEMLSLIPDLTDILVSYYESEATAELSEEPITTPENYQATALPKEIFVRIDDTKTGCHLIVSFRVIKKAVVNLKKPDFIITCVYNEVPVSVDLTTLKAGIVRQLENPNVTLYYYETQQNAIDETGAIASPENYQPDTLPRTVYISFTDADTGCQLLTSVEIVESLEIQPMQVENIISCTHYVLPKLPEGYYYSTEEFGQGDVVKSGTVYNLGSYKIYLNIENTDGCVFSSSYEIEVIDCSIPKGISPNGDGLNDAFDLTYYHPLEVVIYNRDGREVYVYGPGYSNQWYGQNKEGKELPDGTYYYKITTTTEVLTGYVQLLREIK